MTERDRRLLQLLDSAIPRATGSGDWDDVMRKARRRTPAILRWLIGAGAVAAVAAVLAILFVEVGDRPAGEPATSPRPRQPVQVAILSRPQVTQDIMDPAFRAASDWPIDASATRLAQSPDGGKLYVSTARDGKLCLGREHPRLIVHRCEPARDLVTIGAIPLALDDPTGDRFDLFGVVPDGVTKARAAGQTVEVVNNTYWIDSPKRDVPVEIFSPGGWRIVGRQAPEARFSVLERPRTSDDAVPSGVATSRSGGSREPEGDPLLGETRFAVEVDSRPYFVAPADNGNVCILVAGVSNLDIGCRNPATLANIDQFLLLTDRYQVTIVPDGFTSARFRDTVTPIVNNVLVLIPKPSPGGTAILTGPAGRAELDIPPSGGDPVPPRLRLPVEYGQRRPILVVDGGGDPTPGSSSLTMWVAPRRGGGRCWWVTAGTTDDAIFSEGCEPQPPFSPGEAGISVLRGPSGTIALGRAHGDIDTIELRFADGATQTLTVIEGLVLAAVAPNRLEKGHEPVAMTIRTSDRAVRSYQALARSGPAMVSLGVFPSARDPVP